jgi:virulence-associated protein VapD
MRTATKLLVPRQRVQLNAPIREVIAAAPLPAESELRRNSVWASERPGRMYAIAFDLDQELLQRHYPGQTYTNAYEDIGRIINRFGFRRQQGSVYFGDDKVTPVVCVMAVQEVQKQHSWFNKVVSDIRMLRIEENNDLMPAIGDWQLPLS